MAGNDWGPPLVSFGVLGNLGKTFDDAYTGAKKAQTEEQKRKLLASAASGGDLNKIGLGLLGYGDVTGGAALLGLGQKATLLKQQQEASKGFLGMLGSGEAGSATSASSGGSDTYPGTASLIGNESGGNYGARNDAVGAGGARGHFGRAQFGQARLQEAMQAGAIPQGTTPQQFMQSPELQKRAEQWHFSDIDQFIQQSGYDRLVGQAAINGVPVTLEGMRAVAHLGGKAGLSKFMTSWGQYNPRDANGTGLMDYFSRHGGGRSAQADMPAPGAMPASQDPGSQGYAVPGGPQVAETEEDVQRLEREMEQRGGMSGATFDAISGTNAPRAPSFAQAGVSQPWMGSALGSAGGPQTAMTPLPPRRPNDLANVPARGAVPAIGQMPVAPPQMQLQIDPNSPDAGSRTFAVSQGGYAPPPPPAAPVAPAPQPARYVAPAQPVARPAPVQAAPSPQADMPAQGATPTQAAQQPPAFSPPQANGGLPPDDPAPRVTTQQLYGAAANPNLPDDQRALALAIIKRREAFSDQNTKQTDSQRNYELARRQGYAGTFMDYQKEMRAQTNVNVKNEGTVPPGYRVIRDPNGNVERMEPIPGSEAAKKEATAQEKIQRQKDLRVETGNVVANAIDDIDMLMSGSYLPTTGALGTRLAGVPGTAAHDIANALTTIKANTSFQQLQQMREASPTGGALGAVSDAEQAMLSNAYGALNQSQSAEQFKTNLGRVRAIFERIVHGKTLTPKERKMGGPMTAERAKSLREEAAAAIANGAPRDAVAKRLKETYGIDVGGL